jgi:hypothetical protein
LHFDSLDYCVETNVDGANVYGRANGPQRRRGIPINAECYFRKYRAVIGQPVLIRDQNNLSAARTTQQFEDGRRRSMSSTHYCIIFAWMMRRACNAL